MTIYRPYTDRELQFDIILPHLGVSGRVGRRVGSRLNFYARSHGYSRQDSELIAAQASKYPYIKLHTCRGRKPRLFTALNQRWHF